MTRRQPHLIPPPLTTAPSSESFDAEVILREFSGDLALVLWKSVRSVHILADNPPGHGAVIAEGAAEARKRLIAAAGAPREISPRLSRIAAVLHEANPDRVDVAADLSALSRWAFDRGAIGTALELMQSASLLVPGDAVLANEVGRLCRANGDYSRAESWYRQALHTARQARDWEVFASAWIGLGSVHLLRGNYPAAERAYTRALRTAQRYSLRPLIAAAHHELAVVAIRTRKSQRLVRHALAAVEEYGEGHDRLPALAHDIAAFWTVRGYYADALKIFRALRPMSAVGDRLIVASSTARAAAGAGDEVQYRAAWREAVRLLRDSKTAPRAATALLDLAFAAQQMNESTDCKWAAERALEMAVTRGEHAVQLKTEALLTSMSVAGGVQFSEQQSAPVPVQRLTLRLASAVAAEGLQ